MVLKKDCMKVITDLILQNCIITDIKPLQSTGGHWTLKMWLFQVRTGHFSEIHSGFQRYSQVSQTNYFTNKFLY